MHPSYGERLVDGSVVTCNRCAECIMRNIFPVGYARIGLATCSGVGIITCEIMIIPHVCKRRLFEKCLTSWISQQLLVREFMYAQAVCRIRIVVVEVAHL